jgi:hypothetical protein
MVAKYRVLEKVFLKADDQLEASLHEAGDEINFSGIAGRALAPLNDEARAGSALAPLNAMSKNILPRRGDPA